MLQWGVELTARPTWQDRGAAGGAYGLQWGVELTARPTTTQRASTTREKLLQWGVELTARPTSNSDFLVNKLFQASMGGRANRPTDAGSVAGRHSVGRCFNGGAS